MRVVQALTDLEGDAQGVLQPQAASLVPGGPEQGVEILAEEVLHGNEVGPLRTSEVVYLNDVPVLKKSGQLGLVDEGGHHTLLIRQVGEEPLNGDELFEPTVACYQGTVELGHSADGNSVQECVPADDQRLVLCHKSEPGPESFFEDRVLMTKNGGEFQTRNYAKLPTTRQAAGTSHPHIHPLEGGL